MSMLALTFWFVYFLVAFCLRTLVQLKISQCTGWVASRNEPGSLAWNAGLLVAVALLMNVAAVALPAFAPELAWRVWEVPRACSALGALVYVAGLVVTSAAQLQMGADWRIGIDQHEQTGLVAHGLFRVVRNPIYTGMLLVSAGIGALAPSWLSAGGLGLLLVALELQVRALEEPYLARLHGDVYRSYAARTGRFLPGIGRMRATDLARGPA